MIWISVYNKMYKKSIKIRHINKKMIEYQVYTLWKITKINNKFGG